MSFLPAKTLIRIHALALLPLSYYLLTSPPTITDSNIVFMLGEAMALPHLPSPSSSSPSTSTSLPLISAAAGAGGVGAGAAAAAVTALSALLLLQSALTDLSAGAALPEDEAHFYWRTTVPVRLLFFFVVTGGSYLFKDGGPARVGLSGSGWSWREACCNSLVFTWGFLEMVFWFWMFVTLREEGKARAGQEALKRKEQEEERRR